MWEKTRTVIITLHWSKIMRIVLSTERLAEEQITRSSPFLFTCSNITEKNEMISSKRKVWFLEIRRKGPSTVLRHRDVGSRLGLWSLLWTKGGLHERSVNRLVKTKNQVCSYWIQPRFLLSIHVHRQCVCGVCVCTLAVCGVCMWCVCTLAVCGVCVCVCVYTGSVWCVLSHLHPCGETHAYKMVLWGVLTLWGNESLPHKE